MLKTTQADFSNRKGPLKTINITKIISWTTILTSRPILNKCKLICRMTNIEFKKDNVEFKKANAKVKKAKYKTLI